MGEPHEGEKLGQGLSRNWSGLSLDGTTGPGWSQAHKGDLEKFQEGLPKHEAL